MAIANLLINNTDKLLVNSSDFALISSYYATRLFGSLSIAKLYQSNINISKTFQSLIEVSE